jgi:methanogenic corrinoid protein MtbC1
MDPKRAKALIDNVTHLREDEVLEQVRYLLRQKEDPMVILETCAKGMVEVGKRYERGDYFISSLIVGGEIFRQVSEIVQPQVKEGMTASETGTILLGTVQGDIHDLGKNLFGLLAKCHGFTVYDLGVDVSAETFCQKAVELKPNIIGLSCLLRTAYDSMKDIVEQIKVYPGISHRSVIIRASLYEIPDFNEQIGADYWSTSAMSGVYLCKEIMAGQNSLINNPEMGLASRTGPIQ